MASGSAFRVLQQIADAAEPAVRKAYLEAIAAIQHATSAVRLAAAIERGDIGVVDRILNDAHLAAELKKVSAIIRQLTFDAARLEAVRLGVSGAFRVVNPDAVQAAQRQTAKLITRVSAETRKAIRGLVARGVGGELSPLEVAESIRPLIGLTTRQAQAVLNLRSRLSAGRAQDIDAKVSRYAARLLKQRARTIARTETMAAANAGQQATWEQAQKRGLLPQNATRRWITTPDDRLCPLCAAVGGQTVFLDQPFSTPLGAVMNPPLHPQCRCVTAIDAASLAVARGQRAAA